MDYEMNDMYDPRRRLHAFYPPSSRIEKSHEKKPTRTRTRTRTRRQKQRVSLIACVGSADSNSDQRTSSGLARSEQHANTLAKRFGTGNMVVLVNQYNPRMPFTELGITTGCRVDGKRVTGTWTRLADVSHVPRMHDALNAINTLLRNKPFAKVLIPDVTTARLDAPFGATAKAFIESSASVCEAFGLLHLHEEWKRSENP